MSAPVFYVGLHQPSDAHRFARCCLSINRLRERKKPLGCPEILLDSGAFTEIATHGGYRHSVKDYAVAVRRLDGIASLAGVVAQDYMCEPFMLKKTGLSTEEHQRLTIERYDALMDEALTAPIMPVLQGYRPQEYQRHVEAYGARLKTGAWVGVGSVCKRNAKPERIVEVLLAIHQVRPDLRLHGFGVKATALQHSGVRELLFSADSMAWSFAARKQGRNGNQWSEAARFSDHVGAHAARPVRPWQLPLLV